MRIIYFSALAASIGVLSSVNPAAVHAAVATSSADRARIAMLVYQSQSARLADLRRGDAFTKGLRTKADLAEKVVSATRLEVTRARAEGAKAKRIAAALASKLEVQEQALAEAAETYAAELAKRDQEYARERSILITTGQRLLNTPEGRQVLDLFNNGGQANWKEARGIMEEARRVRRSLDARDAAVLYFEARGRGFETTPAVVRAYEEVVRDDPTNRDDWYNLSVLYREQGDYKKALGAAEKALSLAPTPNARVQAVMEVGRAQSAAGDASGALKSFRNAVSLARNLQNPRLIIARLLLPNALSYLANELADQNQFPEARQAYQEAISHYAQMLPKARMWMVYEPYAYSVMGLGNTYWTEDQAELAAPYFEKTLTLADEALSRYPSSPAARELAAKAQIAIADLWVERGRAKDAYEKYSAAEKTYDVLIAEDPGLAWYERDLVYLYRALGGAELSLNKPAKALLHLEKNLRISRKYQSRQFLSSLHSDLLLLGRALLALGREREAFERWTEAVEVGNRLLAGQSSTSPWEAVDQVNIYVYLAELRSKQGDFGNATKLLNQAKALIPRTEKMQVQSQILQLKVAKLEGELTFAIGDRARSARIYEDALAQSEQYVRANPNHLWVRFNVAQLALSASKRASNHVGSERLRLAHDLLREISAESDMAEVHKLYAEARLLMQRRTAESVPGGGY